MQLAHEVTERCVHNCLRRFTMDEELQRGKTLCEVVITMATMALTQVTQATPVVRRAEALFVSALQPSEHPSATAVRSAIGASFREYGGAMGCAAQCAAEFGEHPEVAVPRMRWALTLASV